MIIIGTWTLRVSSRIFEGCFLFELCRALRDL